VDERLFPDGFLDTYRRLLGGGPPREFVEAYEVLAETFYFGTGLAYEDAGDTTGGRIGSERGVDFKEPRLRAFKWSVDRRLAALAQELRDWAVAREGPEPSGRVPADARARRVGEPRDVGAPEPHGEA